MKKPALLILFLGVFAFAHSQDTITVQTFSFGSHQNAWFVFPSDTVSFEKILMKYTLKCNPAQNPACGEWDYLTNTYLYDHTGLTDSAMVSHAVFSVNGNYPDSFCYSAGPTWTYDGSWQYSISYNDTTSLNTYFIDPGTSAFSHPLGSSSPVSRSLFLWKASELSAIGMSAGNITGIRLNILTASTSLRHFSIRMKLTSADTLSAANPDLTGLSDLYYRDFVPVAGWNSFAFIDSFYWDGTSNIIVEFSFENTEAGSDNLTEAANTGFSSGIIRAGQDRCVSFTGSGYIPVHITPAMLDIDSSVSVCFRAFGNPDLQPQSGTCFEGVDAAGNRLLNAHVPWSNQTIYWDAGNSSGYDRISKAATTENTEGKWNYWAFTKNAASGTMKIFLNGSLWHSGTGLTKNIDPVALFSIGKGNWSGSVSYEGRIDDFSVFKTELSAQEIADWFDKPVLSSHPQFSNLVMSFGFNEGNGVSVTDSACGNTIASSLVSVTNPLLHPDDYTNGFVATTMRPDIVFEQGIFVSQTDSVFVPDSSMNAPVQIVFFSDSINNPGMPTDTMIVWPACYYNYIYSSQGQITDSVFIAPDSVLHQSFYYYYNYFPQIIRYELARYITPYGNGLSLGDGWTWTFDVSDYRPLLSDSVHLSAGNWQELLDVKFIMIKGTPPRDALSIQNLWNGNFNYGFNSDPVENHLTPIKVKIPAEALTARWKSRITGHGMDTPENCAEFCPKYHYFLVDSVERFSKLVWRDNCDLNPLYPQGGTWVYDRANWCPGAEVWTYDFELSPYMVPGDSIELDHNIDQYSNNGEWDYFQIEDQLVTYGAPHFSLDASIYNVLSPTTDQMYKRLNPICSSPVVVIKNTGSTNLHTADISYGISGATPSVFHWTGNLEFMKEDTVLLDTFSWAQGASEFVISISNPNGGTDQYQPNNVWKTTFKYVPVMPQRFVVLLRTNNNPEENSYIISDNEGHVVFSRSGLAPNTTYSDTVDLTEGCYFFRLTDTGEDGLSFWANPDQGSGYIKFKSAESVVYLMNFIADFGGEIYMQFTVGLNSSIENQTFSDKPLFKVYPNPADKQITVDFNLPTVSSGRLEISDLMGKVVFESEFSGLIADSRLLDISGYKPGIYMINLTTPEYFLSQKIVIR